MPFDARAYESLGHTQRRVRLELKKMVVDDPVGALEHFFVTGDSLVQVYLQDADLLHHEPLPMVRLRSRTDWAVASSIVVCWNIDCPVQPKVPGKVQGVYHVHQVEQRILARFV